LKQFNKLISLLQKRPLEIDEFVNLAKESEINEYLIESEIIESMTLQGLPIYLSDGKIELKSSRTNWQNERFCIVDIETNGNKPEKSQIIEIGAVIIQDFKIIDKFESFIYASEVPEHITRLTTITKDDLKDAPSLKETLYKFRLFLSDSIFVAHNVKFDYNYICKTLNLLDIGTLLNRKLCSIDLARKTIVADKYGLGHLMEILDIKSDNHHRAYADAKATAEIFMLSLKKLPKSIITSEDLINFAQNNSKKISKKRVKKDKN
jgi:DNA polymerase-3 subunit epsilon